MISWLIWLHGIICGSFATLIFLHWKANMSKYICIVCGGPIEDTPRMIAACDKCIRENPGLNDPP